MGAFDQAAVYARINGTLGSEQTWSTGFWVGYTGDPVPTSDQVNDLAGDFAGFANTWATALEGLWTSTTAIDSVTVAFFPTGALHPTLLGEATVGVEGSGSLSMPASCCLVATNRTARPGRSYRGRNYIPLTNPAVMGGVTFEVTEGTTVTVANAHAALFHAVNENTPDSPLIAGTVSVGSRAASVLTPVIEVSVDSRPDVQRRREDKVGALFTHDAAVTI